MKRKVRKFTHRPIDIRHARALTSEDGTTRLESGINISRNQNTGVRHFVRRAEYLEYLLFPVRNIWISPSK